MTKNPTLRVAWFSPVSDKFTDGTSLCAYTTDLLFDKISKEFDLTLFTDQLIENSSRKVRHPLDAFRAHRETPFDIFFYQLDSHPLSRVYRQFLGLEPGIVWFHQVMLADYGPEPILNSPWSDTVKKFSAPQRYDWASRGKEYNQGDHFTKRENALALLGLYSQERDLTVVHSRKAKGLVADFSTTLPKRIWQPVPVDEALFKFNRSSKDQNFHISFVGSPQIENRAHKLLEAVSNLPFTDWTLCWLVNSAERAAAEELLFLTSLRDRVELKSPQNCDSWKTELVRSDVAIHTAFSGYSNLSPYLEMSLAAAKPVISLRHGAAEFLPEDIIFQVEPGRGEARQIALVIEQIKENDNLRVNTGGQVFAREHCSVDVVTQELSCLFKEYTKEYLPLLRSRWETLLRSAKSELLRESRLRVRGDVFDSLLQRDLIQPVFRELGWGD